MTSKWHVTDVIVPSWRRIDVSTTHFNACLASSWILILAVLSITCTNIQLSTTKFIFKRINDVLQYLFIKLPLLTRMATAPRGVTLTRRVYTVFVSLRNGAGATFGRHIFSSESKWLSYRLALLEEISRLARKEMCYSAKSVPPPHPLAHSL